MAITSTSMTLPVNKNNNPNNPNNNSSSSSTTTTTMMSQEQRRPTSQNVMSNNGAATSASSSSSPPVVMVVCCECRPSSKPRRQHPPVRRRFRKLTNSISSRIFKLQKFYDAQMEILDDNNDNPNSSTTRDVLQSNRESLFYFDAEEELLGDDEYPIRFTDSILHPKPNVSMDDPASMLRSSSSIVTVTFADSKDKDNDNDKEENESSQRSKASPQKTSSSSSSSLSEESKPRRLSSAPIADYKSRSGRFEAMIQRSTGEQKDELEEPRVKIPLKGYPGGLSETELAECEHFLKALKSKDPALSEQVYTFRDIEEEPYTICRWLRATKFKAEDILQRIEDNQSTFEDARQHDFYPNPSEAIGAPFPIFLSQYPFLPIGWGKNGCPVNYFLAGKINPEGMLSMTTGERLTGYFWWSFMYKFKQEIRKARQRDPDFVRVEGINILDLQGLSSSALSSDTMDVIKMAGTISDFFPETLHCMLIINAPGFFSMSWGLIKKFIDPRTAQRIQVFSNSEKGLNALHQLVDSEQIPVDYGGKNKSMKQAFMDEAGDPLLKTQEIELLHVKRKNNITAKTVIQLEKNEYIEIRVYTRSPSSAEITVQLNDETYKTKTVKCTWGTSSDSTGGTTSTPLPNCTVVIDKLVGPGKINVMAQDLDDIDKKVSNGTSRGFFLLACEVKDQTKANNDQNHHERSSGTSLPQ